MPWMRFDGGIKLILFIPMKSVRYGDLNLNLGKSIEMLSPHLMQNSINLRGGRLIMTVRGANVGVGSSVERLNVLKGTTIAGLQIWVG